MMRNEFVQRAAIAALDGNAHAGRHYGSATIEATYCVETAQALANEVAKVAPFDEKDDVADAIDSVYQKLDGIEDSLDAIAEGLPLAGCGT